MTGIKRNLFEKAQFLLNKFPVIAIVGARQVGKTTFSSQLRPSWKYVDLENPNDYQQVTNDAVLFFKQYDSNVIIDEAQIYPDLFKVMRGVVDADRKKYGRFILTGSSSPELLENVSETLAGRIAIIELGTLKINEYYEKKISSFYGLFSEKLDKNNLNIEKPYFSSDQVQQSWLNGGYPEPVLNDDALSYATWMEQYAKTYVDRDIARLFPKLNKIKYQQFIGMLSKLSGTIINKSELGRTLEINESSAREYLRIAHGTYMWREIPSFEKNIIKAVIKRPKGYIRDTGLLHYFLKISDLDDLYIHPQVAFSFEGFIIEEIIKGLTATLATNWNVYYYRTRNGAEIDLIIDGPFGLLPIEIKYSSHVPFKKLSTLNQFIEEHNLPLGIVICLCDDVYWHTEKIVQLPAGVV